MKIGFRKGWGLAACWLVLFFGLAGPAPGASFSCKKAGTFIEKAICGNKLLSALDDEMDVAYRKALKTAEDPEGLRGQQKVWLLNVRNSCQDETCLRRVYMERLASLEAYARPAPTRPAAPVCEFAGLNLPTDFAVFAAGGYTGRKIAYQIDQSGHEGTQMDVSVHEPSKAVVLMLGAYEPTIWNIRWSPSTRIAAVLVSGYHRQVIAGLDPAVPTLNTSYDNKGPCGYFYVNERDLDRVNPTARKLFGKSADLVFLAKNGVVHIGSPLPEGVTLASSPATPPESFYDRNAPIAGPAGLEDGVRKGLLRKATVADADEWVNAVIASTPERDAPPVAGVGTVKPPRPTLHNAYVVLKPYTYPAGLYGGHLATFFIPRGVPLPAGNPGHSSVYDYNKLRCQGPMCNNR